jgi:hypothetical protein
LTQTAPGHASLATGCSPDRHGIVGNNWYERSQAVSVYAVAAGRNGRGILAKSEGGSPRNLLSPTVGDALKDATGGRGKVVTMSLKDRSAILPAGRQPDACYWLDGRTGQFITSSYYRDVPHGWVTKFNLERPADRWVGQEWVKLYPKLDYTAYSGPDDIAGEGLGFGRTFPHRLGFALGVPNRLYYDAMELSPYGNDLLLAFAKRAIEAEGLGTGDRPDFLSISFSSNDLVGHVFGPDSQEVLDITLRSDLVVRDLLAFLDQRVGPGNYVVVLSADHGICPLPAFRRAQGRDAGFVAPDIFGSRAQEYLQSIYGRANEPAPRWLETVSGPWFYLNQRVLEQRGLVQTEVEKKLAAWLGQQPGMLAGYSMMELKASGPSEPIGQRVLKSYHPDRCGDVYGVMKPYYLLGNALTTGTNHGTPHDYDTHVPLFVFGAVVRPGIHKEAITPQAAAAILSVALGVALPRDAEAPLPQGIGAIGQVEAVRHGR